ncbi:Cupredoxin, partial [Pelagophyceae sp. CCMP2097]
GPTIEVLSGDALTLTLQNDLSANPTGEDTTINSMHSPNSINLHTHGLHIDPTVDTIFTSAAPGETLVYSYEVSADHAPGTHWYHDHTHGGAAMRIMGGLHGALVVKP